jgi:peptidoglycan/LPS O-acetylase OafA/YrhL
MEGGAKQAVRNDALDFAKGALVLIMVLYHWLNYFVSTQGSFYRYLRFLTPSFIFITGFLLSNIYSSRYDDAAAKPTKRLIGRGLKLLLVFLALNVGAGLALHGLMYFSTIPDLAQSLLTIISSGNVAIVGQGKALSFSILVPISYLLMISAVLLAATRTYKYTLRVACAAFLASIVLLNFVRVTSANLEYLAIGLIGMVLGEFPIQRINAFTRHRIVPILGLYLLYIVAITFWGTLYPLQIVGVCLSVALLYLLGKPESGLGKTGRVVVLLGRYSLFGYIAQIAILQILKRGLQKFAPGTGWLVLSFFAAFALTLLSVNALDKARLKLRPIDRIYRAVFA